MGFQLTPRGMRIQIGIFGRRNVGKSSLLNAITNQQVSIVSEIAGTTTDPVEKPMEFLPLGTVSFIDTAGIDDLGALGKLRIQKTMQVIERADIGIIVAEASFWGEFEQNLLSILKKENCPTIVVFNKIDEKQQNLEIIDKLDSLNIPHVETSATKRTGILELRELILKACPDECVNNPSIAADLVGKGEFAVLVVPIDKEAPKGRLILPQVQTIRDLLDHDAFSIVVKEHELKLALDCLKQKPKLVITDSQAFLKVAEDTPIDIPLTSFSILFSRFKGDLISQLEGTLAIDKLKPGDKILIAESCSHHPIEEDIGRVKIPRWLEQYVGGKLDFEIVSGHDFPQNLSSYKLVIQCGSCMLNRRETLSRILKCHQANVPCTNYGLTIAYSLGILERALGPFPAALDLYKNAKVKKWN